MGVDAECKTCHSFMQVPSTDLCVEGKKWACDQGDHRENVLQTKVYETPDCTGPLKTPETSLTVKTCENGQMTMWCDWPISLPAPKTAPDISVDKTSLVV